MFVGHYSVSYAAKTQAPHVPLWVWFIAVQWLDVVWSILILAGIEKMRIVPGFTEGSAYDLYYMPYSHGLPGAIVLSLIFGAMVALASGGARGKTLAWVAVAAFSHWVLDLFVHVPDLPLYDDSAKVGFGLWRHVAVSFPLELILLLAGAWLYARSATFALRAQRHICRRGRARHLLGLHRPARRAAGLRQFRPTAVFAREYGNNRTVGLSAAGCRGRRGGTGRGESVIGKSAR